MCPPTRLVWLCWRWMRRTRACARVQSPGHSAHLGQDVVVHYRWHPLYGRRVGLRRSEQRSSGRFVQIEAEPGVVTVVAAWMLDPVACAGMEIGSRRGSVDALIELHRLLCERGYRRNSPDDAIVVQEERDGEPEDRTGANDGSTPAEPGARFREVARHQSARADRHHRPTGAHASRSRRHSDEGA